jgi:dolichol-phosphate mannosyltransferase
MDNGLHGAEMAMSTNGSDFRPPELAVIVPTFNERGNVTALFRLLETALAGIAWEVIYVDDDSRDGTLDELQDLSRKDGRVRYLHRIGRRGLASAVVEGMLATNSSYIAVIDCDLQHDETKLPEMLDLLRCGAFDVVVGSRYMEQGGFGDWPENRRLISQAATRLAHAVLPVALSDPMSGFFALTREAFQRSVRGLSKQGYKILLDIVLSFETPPRVREVPYTFRRRTQGQSKLDSSVVIDYLVLLLDKTVGHLVPARFILFAAVGASGVIVHMLSLVTLMALSIGFTMAQAGATLAAMTFNFFVNNILTYRDERLKGLRPVVGGLLSFYAVCALGAVSNVGVASVLFEKNYVWWLSAIVGILVGVVWNYALTSTFTWRGR